MGAIETQVIWATRLGDGFPRSLVRVRDRLVVHVSQPPLSSALTYTLEGGHCWSTEFAGIAVCGVGDGIVVDGPEVVKLEIETGRIASSRRFESYVELRSPSALGPVVSVESESGPPLGLHVLSPLTLQTVWSAPDPYRTLVHGSFACRHHQGVAAVDVTELATGATKQAVVPNRGWHHHYQNLWCEFSGRERAAFDLASGAQVWNWEDDAVWHGGRSIAESDSRLFVHSAAGLSCFDLTSGAVIWRVPAKASGVRWLNGLERQLCLSGNVLWCMTSEGVYRLRSTDGQLLGRWSNDAVAPISGLALDERRIVVLLDDSLRYLDFSGSA